MPVAGVWKAESEPPQRRQIMVERTQYGFFEYKHEYFFKRSSMVSSLFNDLQSQSLFNV